MGMDLDMRFYILMVRSHVLGWLQTLGYVYRLGIWVEELMRVGTHIYTLCELSSTLVVHPFSPGSESTDQQKGPISRHSILPPADSSNGPKMLASEIILLPSHNGGKHLLVCTNRDTPNNEGDALALFSVGDDGSVERTEQGWVEGVGRHLRGMLPDKSGQWVAVAGRDEGGVTIFERDVSGTGLRLDKVAHLEVDQVVVPLWID